MAVAAAATLGAQQRSAARGGEWTATFSIVAHDSATGETGVGVKSRAFGSGARVLWAKPGVGAVVRR